MNMLRSLIICYVFGPPVLATQVHNALAGACARSGRWRSTFAGLQELQVEGLSMSEVTYNAALLLVYNRMLVRVLRWSLFLGMLFVYMFLVWTFLVRVCVFAHSLFFPFFFLRGGGALA